MEIARQQLGDNNGNYWRTLGKAYTVVERHEDSVRSYEKALAIGPSDRALLYLLGQAYQRVGKMDLARKMLAASSEAAKAEQVREQSRTEQSHSQPAERTDRAMTALIQCLLLAFAENAAVTAGKKAFDRAQYEEAIRIWQSGDSKDCEVPFYIGLAQYRLKRISEALIQFRTAVSCAPNQLLPRIALAEALAASGDQNRAIAQYEEALKIDPKSIDALRPAAFLSVTNQLNDKAVGLLERLLEIAPTDTAARAQLGAAYAAIGRMEDAETALKAALQQDATNASALIGLANVYLKTGVLSQRRSCSRKRLCPYNHSSQPSYWARHTAARDDMRTR